MECSHNIDPFTILKHSKICAYARVKIKKLISPVPLVTTTIDIDYTRIANGA